jgi:hypothetical protein
MFQRNFQLPLSGFSDGKVVPEDLCKRPNQEGIIYVSEPTRGLNPCKLKRVLGYRHTKVAWDMNKELVFEMGTDEMIPTYSLHKPFTVTLAHEGEWKGGYERDWKQVLVWYRDGFKARAGIGRGVYGWDMSRKLSFNLQQAQQCAIMVCIMENVHRTIII